MPASPMKVVTVRRPWAWALIHGGKNVENRRTNIAGAYRGPLAIHVAKAYDAEPARRDSWDAMFTAMLANGADTEMAPWAGHAGCIIGVVDLIDSHRHTVAGGAGCADTNAQSHFGSRICSPWADLGAQHLLLANPRPLVVPIPMRGALGIRDLDADMTARILAALT